MKKFSKHQVRSSLRNFWPWLFLIYCFSYKMKILGEIAQRPLYMRAVVFAVLLLLWLLFITQKKYKFKWGNSNEPSLFLLILVAIFYIFFQSLLYPLSIKDVLYTVVTVFLCFVVTFTSIVTYGWIATVNGIFFALLSYCIINIVILGGGFVFPSFLEYLPVSPLDSGYGIRISGLAGDPTHLGAFFSITLVLMFALRKELCLLWSIPIAVLIFIGLLATGTRNAILSMVFGILLGLIGDGGAKKIVNFSINLTIASGLVFGILSVFFDDFDGLFSQLFRFDDENAYSRLSIWKDMFEIASRLSPFEVLFGGGYLFIQDEYGSPYNAFLRIFFNQGIIYLIVLSVIIFLLFFFASRDKDFRRRGVVFALLGYWISFSMFLDTFFAEFFHVSEFIFWVAAAIVVTVNMTLRQPAINRRI